MELSVACGICSVVVAADVIIAVANLVAVVLEPAGREERVCGELHVSSVGRVAAHCPLLARAPRVVELCAVLDGVVCAGRPLAAHGLAV